MWRFWHRPFASPAVEPRWIAGIHVAMDGLAVEGALLVVHGHGCGMRAELAATSQVDVPKNWGDTIACPPHDESAAGDFFMRAPRGPALLDADFQARWLQLVGEAILPLAHFAERQRPRKTVPTVALFDAGDSAGGPLLDGGLLAETTSLNVIWNFAARDRAAGGLGGPLLPLAEWILLRIPKRGRALVDLGETLRLTLLPPAREPPDWLDVVATQLGPGRSLLSAAHELLWETPLPKDGGAGLAAGTVSRPELRTELAGLFHQRPLLPRFQHDTPSPEPWLAALAAASGSLEPPPSREELFASAAQGLADGLILALEKLVPPSFNLRELLLTGAGAKNGLLLSRLADRWPDVLQKPLEEAGWKDETLRPACAAVLGALLLDQTPANLPTCTGARSPRLLGQVSPGSPQNWRKLLSEPGGKQAPIALRGFS